ncbi:unnamed protein product [Heligmosomoides polygyrus]|uniref:RRM domain-containing protein n=1 Tax=Heligmosomoides polygyrus TaxID=6339 RepID=A0A3P7Y9P2_HELPZ|nr:unnamed protein product [Heligmosomoides polygyrus]
MNHLQMIPSFASSPVFDMSTGIYYATGATAVIPTPAYELIPHRVFVGGFPASTTELELREHFEQFFTIKEVKVIRSADGVSKGYGFITFDTDDEADTVRGMVSHLITVHSSAIKLLKTSFSLLISWSSKVRSLSHSFTRGLRCAIPGGRHNSKGLRTLLRRCRSPILQHGARTQRPPATAAGTVPHQHTSGIAASTATMIEIIVAVGAAMPQAETLRSSRSRRGTGSGNTCVL